MIPVEDYQAFRDGLIDWFGDDNAAIIEQAISNHPHVRGTLSNLVFQFDTAVIFYGGTSVKLTFPPRQDGFFEFYVNSFTGYVFYCCDVQGQVPLTWEGGE